MIIIGDVHASYTTLLALIEQLPHTNICFVGDLIDRGANSKQVVELVKSKYKTVKGNHESMMVNAHRSTSYRDKNLWVNNGGHETLVSFQDYTDEQMEDIIDWMEELPLYIEYTNQKEQHFIISHSNINFSWNKRESDPDEFKEWCLWSRNFNKTLFGLSKIGDSINVIGHTPVKYVNEVGELIFIDTGCVFKDSEGLGKLTAYDLETGEVFQQENID